jgi:hypothetical protein
MPSNGDLLGMRLSAVVSLVAIFAAGALSGAGLYRWAAQDHGPPLPPLPYDALGLSAEQKERAETIMQKHRPELEALIRATFPRVKAVHEKIDGEIRTILNEEQRKRFDEMRARRPRMGDPGRPGSHGGPFGPRGFHLGPPPDGIPPGILPPLPPPSPPPPGAAGGAALDRNVPPIR